MRRFNLEEELGILAETCYETAIGFVSDDDVEDPRLGTEVFAHYAKTHLATALLQRNDEESRVLANSLLRKFLRDYAQHSVLPEFHNDFNNYAISLALDTVDCPELKSELEHWLISAEDSGHETINWLPMRAHVNFCRSRLSRAGKYRLRAKQSLRLVAKALNKDHFFEDRLPLGYSFNQQYAISTLAVVVKHELPVQGLDIVKAYQAIANLTDHEGDVNFFGRGANQIFAWGPWIHLCIQIGDLEGAKKAVGFVLGRINSIKNGNIHLNDNDPADRLFWTDYHYSSVYICHFYMWLELAKKQLASGVISNQNIINREKESNGVVDFGAFRIITFMGTSNYTCERGPTIANISHEKYGAIVKGGLGPYQDDFSATHVSPTLALANNFGFWRVIKSNRLTKTLYGLSTRYDFCYLNFTCSARSQGLSISWSNPNSDVVKLNLPVQIGVTESLKFELFLDEEPRLLRFCGIFPSIYDEVKLFESEATTAKKIRLEISENCSN